MADVLVIDKTGQIKPELSTVRAQIQYIDDEVKAINELEKSSSAVVLLHYDVRKEQTADYIRLIVKTASQSKVVVVAQELSEKEILACLLSGAQGYQHVERLSHYSARLIAAVKEGEAWITRRMTTKVLDSLRLR